MKRNFIKVSLVLSPIVVLSGCNFMQVGNSPSGYINPNRVSVVEKAWKARHEYDSDSGLLRPYYRGMRYGAVRSYNQQEKTVASKEWWVKDQKREDLADQPFRTTPTRLPPQITPATAVAGAAPNPVGGNTAANPDGFVESPAAGAASATPGSPGSGASTTNVEVFGSGSGAGLPVFATGEETPAMPATPGGITGEALGIDSPFLPSTPSDPSALPPVPGAAFPGAALPGAPIGNTPFGVDPAVPGGGAPAMPAPGGDNPFGAPAPAAPAPGGANPFGGPPPAPAPAGDNPFGAPAPAVPAPAPPAPGGDNPFPAPPAPGGDNPFPAPPAPGGDNPFPPPPAP